MGGRQSRVDHINSKTEDPDDWMSRVEVKPSMRLVARLEQQQRDQGVIGASSEPLTTDDDDNERSKQEESSELAVHQEEYEGRSSELRVAKNGEAAHLARMVSSVSIPKLTSLQQSTACSDESQCVLKCYRSQRKTGGELNCSSFVDALEACASNATSLSR